MKKATTTTEKSTLTKNAIHRDIQSLQNTMFRISSKLYELKDKIEFTFEESEDKENAIKHLNTLNIDLYSFGLEIEKLLFKKIYNSKMRAFKNDN